ncbi:MAG TPA: DUF444 family protein [Bacteroidales bacterium]|nr:DUF444 family protein [Bacteroidales bacterium]HPS15715.1 DUF444 family protein [Bacteroidales bacterium]
MKNILKTYNQLKKQNLSPEQSEIIEREMELYKKAKERGKNTINKMYVYQGLYDTTDFDIFLNFIRSVNKNVSLQTLEDLLARDKKREEDGLPRRIKIGKFIKPDKNKKEQIVVVPTTTEPKFYHDNSTTEESEQTGGSGDGEEGDILGEQPIKPTEGEGEGTGAGQGESGDHDISSDAFDLGKILTEKFELPNLKTKGKKVSLTKFQYDLTDKNRGFGQLLDKRTSLKKIIQTNILLGKADPSDINPDDLIVNPNDKIYRIMSKEKDFEAQAVVFFIRDYSGSMQGKPTEAVVTQHLLIYSWLMFQYQKNVTVRFVLHDTEAKEVKDFYEYYKSAVAGGTSVYAAYEYVANVIEKEQLAKDYNIFVFHGTDGDDWEEKGEKAIDAIKRMLPLLSRMGITVARNSWTVGDKLTTVEQYIEDSGLLDEKNKLLRIDSFSAETITEERLIEGIKKLLS